MSLEVMLRGPCAIANPEGSQRLDPVENFTLFVPVCHMAS